MPENTTPEDAPPQHDVEFERRYRNSPAGTYGGAIDTPAGGPDRPVRDPAPGSKVEPDGDPEPVT